MLRKPKLIKKNAAIPSKNDELSDLSAEFIEKKQQKIMLQKALQLTSEWTERRRTVKACARQMFADLFIKSDAQST